MQLEGLKEIEFDDFRGEPQFIGEFQLGSKYAIVGEWFYARNNQENDYCVLKLFKLINNKAYYERIISKFCWYNQDYPQEVMEIDNIGFGGCVWCHVSRYRYEKTEKIGVLRRW